MEPGGAVESAARLLTVPFGAPATDALAATIAAAKAGDLLAPVTVVVPGNLTGLALRRELGGRGDGLFNVRFFVLDRLAELLGAGTLAASGRRPLDDAVKAALVRQVLSGRPAPLERVASRPRHRASGDRAPRRAASVGAGRGRTRSRVQPSWSVSSCHDRRRFRALAAHSFYDGTISRSGRHTRSPVARPTFATSDRWCCISRTGFRRQQLDLVNALAGVDRLWAVVGLTGEAEPDADAAQLVDRLSVSLGPPQAITPTARPCRAAPRRRGP